MLLQRCMLCCLLSCTLPRGLACLVACMCAATCRAWYLCREHVLRMTSVMLYNQTFTMCCDRSGSLHFCGCVLFVCSAAPEHPNGASQSMSALDRAREELQADSPDKGVIVSHQQAEQMACNDVMHQPYACIALSKCIVLCKQIGHSR